MDGWTDKWINKQKEDGNEGRTDRAERQTDIKMDERMNMWLDGRIDGNTDRWKDKVTDGQMTAGWRDVV
jgi:hypothetical protein